MAVVPQDFLFNRYAPLNRWLDTAERVLILDMPLKSCFDHEALRGIRYRWVIEPKENPVINIDRVVVLGPGTIGILCAAMARLCGAQVALVGLPKDAHRLEIARGYGCEIIIGDAKPWAMERDGLGCDGVIDAAGASATLKIALDIVRPAGWISKVGWGPQPLGFNLDPLVQKNITLQGSFSHNWPIWERVIALLASGQLDVRPIIGGVWPVTEWHEAFEKMHSGEVVKSVLRPV